MGPRGSDLCLDPPSYRGSAEAPRQRRACICLTGPLGVCDWAIADWTVLGWSAPADGWERLIGLMALRSGDGRLVRPPSAPRNLLVHATTSSSITLNWDPPADHGSRSDLEYRISCAECGNQVLYRPGWHGFNTTSVTITNLNPSSSYRLIVYAENGVSNMSGSVASAFKIARTEASAKVIGLRRVSSNANRITIAWELPASMVGDVTQFKVRYFPDQREDIAVSKYTTNRNLTVTDFELDTAYIFLAGKLLIHHSDMEQATFSVRGGAQTGSMVRGHGPCGPHTSVEAGGAGL
ncbi:hypothetical protein ACOMHN_067157 [Nucella lapillus]